MYSDGVGPSQVPLHVVAEEDGLLGGDVQLCERVHEESRVRLAGAGLGGENHGVKVFCDVEACQDSVDSQVEVGGDSKSNALGVEQREDFGSSRK